MKKTNIVRNVLAVSAVLSAFLPFGAFAGPQLPAGFVKPTLQAPQASDLVIASLKNQISSLQKQNDGLRTQLKIEQCPDQVDECTRRCYVGTDVCGEEGPGDAETARAEICFAECSRNNDVEQRLHQWR